MLRATHNIIDLGLKITLLLFVISLVGCASVSTESDNLQTPFVEADALANGNSWWYCRVKVGNVDDDSPNWSMGALLAGEVFLPILEQYRPNIERWRFHRRAGRDKAGHQFSFIFYSSAQTAQSIYRDLDKSELLRELIRDGHIDAVKFDDLNQLKRPNIEDTSDKSWPLMIQKSWPDYIMGVSQMWLNLVESLAQENADADMFDQYVEVQKDLTELWVENGQHAWLHHLNALYAYEPFMIRY